MFLIGVLGIASLLIMRSDSKSCFHSRDSERKKSKMVWKKIKAEKEVWEGLKRNLNYLFPS